MQRYQPILLFVLISLLSITLSYLTEQILLTKEFFNSLFANKISTAQLEEIMTVRGNWRWLGFSVIPLIIFIRTFLISLCLWIGLFLRELNIPIKTLLQITIKAEIVHLWSPLWTLIWFGLIHKTYAPTDIQNFYPLSLASALGLENAEPWMRYPLSMLNIFELIYVLLLSYIVSETFGGDFSRYSAALRLIILTYGTGLFLWMLLLTFLLVGIST